MAEKKKLTPEQRKANRRTLGRLMKFVRPYRMILAVIFLCAAVSVAAQLIIPIFTGNAIDNMIGAGKVNFSAVGGIVLVIGIAAGLAALAQWVLTAFSNRITFGVSRDLRNAAIRKLQHLPLKYLDSHPSGDLVSRFIADVDAFADGLLMGFTQLFTGVLTILGTLVFMLTVNPLITLVVVALTPLSLFTARFIAKRINRFFVRQTKARGDQTAFVNEMLDGMKVVQAFGHEEASQAAFDALNDEVTDAAMKATFYSSLINPTTRFVNNLIYAAVALVGALTAIGGSITIGQVSIFLSYATQYARPFNDISGVVTELQNAIACAERVFQLLDEP